MVTSNHAVRLLVIAALAIGLSGCGNEERLTIYSGRSQNLVGPLLERFSEESGVPIDVRYGESAELALLIDEEGDAGRADVFYSQSPGATGFLSENGRLAELPSELLEQVDEEFRDPEGEWIGITGRQRVLVYNTEQMTEADLPESVFDVTGEEYAGRVAVAPENGSFQDFVTAMRTAEGDEATLEWLTALAEDGAPTYANNNAIVEAVDRGEVDMGLVNHYYALQFLEEDPDLEAANYVFPNGDLGALVLPSTASVTATSDNPDAMEPISFLLSEEAQQYFAEETKEYPLAAGNSELSVESAPDVDVTQLGGGLERTLELIEESGLGG